MLIHETLENSLQKYFGYSTFRTGQKEIITDCLRGNDVLGVLPTGSGKSVCYQLPAKLLPGTTIVVSPLISLMIDQVKQLKATNFKSVIALNSFMDYTERKQVYQNLGFYKLIYVSPELLQQPELVARLQKLTVSLFVVDEAHCISQWGHEFRPDYLKLNTVIRALNNPTILALSATATESVQADIIKFLDRPQMVKRIYPMDRKNIIFSIEEVDNDLEKIDILLTLFKKYRIPTIIYFSSRQMTETIAATLLAKLSNQRIAFYHGGMDQMDRIQIQQQFMNDQLDIICCTSAFGMGINKQNIRLVIHFHLPPQLESYIQEVGRAGRDGEPSVGLLLYSKNDIHLPKHLIMNELPSENQLSHVFQQMVRLYENNLELPKTPEQVENYFQLSETQWRFLYYQFENHGMINENNIQYNQVKWVRAFEQIKRFVEERIRVKEKKLAEILGWINVKSCLREALYQPFQKSYQQPEGDCCSNCGFTFSSWMPLSVPAHSIKGSWQEKLYTLLMGTNDGEAK